MPTEFDMAYARSAVRSRLVSRDDVEGGLRIQDRLEQQGKVVRLHEVLLQQGTISSVSHAGLLNAFRRKEAENLATKEVPLEALARSCPNCGVDGTVSEDYCRNCGVHRRTGQPGSRSRQCPDCVRFVGVDAAMCSLCGTLLSTDSFADDDDLTLLPAAARPAADAAAVGSGRLGGLSADEAAAETRRRWMERGIFVAVGLGCVYGLIVRPLTVEYEPSESATLDQRPAVAVVARPLGPTEQARREAAEWLAKRQFKRAAATLQKALRASPGNPVIRADLALVAARSGDQGAAAAAARALASEPGAASALDEHQRRSLSRLLLRSAKRRGFLEAKQWEEARRIYHDAMTLHDEAGARHGHGLALLGLGKPREALKDLQRARTLDADDVGISVSLAGALEKVDSRRAAAQWRQIIDAAEEDPGMQAIAIFAKGRLAGLED